MLMVMGVGCSGRTDNGDTSSSAGPKPAEIADKEGVQSRLLGGHLKLSTRNAVEAGWEADIPLRVVTVASADAPREFWLLSIGLQEPVEVKPGVSMRTAFDLVGYYGEGTYVVAAPGSPAPASGGGAQSAAFLIASEGERQTNFNQLLEPCQIVVGKMARSGTIDCPRVSDGQREVGFSWAWTVNPKNVLADDSPISDPPYSAPPPLPAGNPTTPTSVAAPASERTKTMLADFPLDGAVTPLCVRQGKAAMARVETVPNASVTLVPSFADGGHHGVAHLGTTDGDGVLEWRFIVPPDAPDGDASILVNVVWKQDGEDKAGAGFVPFTVGRKSC